MDVSQCVICQGIKAEKLVKPTENGVFYLKVCAHPRLKYRDMKNRLVIDNTLWVLDADSQNETSLVWHKTCYVSFTSKLNITRVQQRESPAAFNKFSNQSSSQLSCQSSQEVHNTGVTF